MLSSLEQCADDGKTKDKNQRENCSERIGKVKSMGIAICDHSYAESN